VTAATFNKEPVMSPSSLSRFRKCVVAFASIALFAGCASVQDSGRLLHPIDNSPHVFPESVAVTPRGEFFVGSVREGTLYRGRVGESRLDVFSPAAADGRSMATGLFWRDERLAVAGRQTGQVFVYDTGNARLLAKIHNGLPSDQTFLNDVTIAPSGDVYITDSIQPVLWRAKPTAAGYQLERFLEFGGTSLQYIKARGAAGINVNGIAASADGRWLIVGKRNENALFRIDLASHRVDRISMPQGTLETPDGLFLNGRTLYVAQNMPRAIAVLQLGDDFLSAEKTATVQDDSFRFPTAVAVSRGRMLIVNSQFDSLGSPAAVSGDRPPLLPFTVSELPTP